MSFGERIISHTNGQATVELFYTALINVDLSHNETFSVQVGIV